MSLVAYDASSDEESDSEEPEIQNPINTKINACNDAKQKEPQKVKTSNGHISDDDEDYGFDSEVQTSIDLFQVEKPKLNLPLPKASDNEPIVPEPEESPLLSIHSLLPAPKTIASKTAPAIVEEDDEFLHKKATAPPMEKPQPKKRQPVKITIPSLSKFMEFKVEKQKSCATAASKSSMSLLSILPEPKNEEIFAKKTSESSKKPTATVTSLVPDHVKNRMKNAALKKDQTNTNTSKSLVNDSDSEDSDDNEDFFSLNSKIKLPDVSDNEVKAMVQKKMSEMAKGSKKINDMLKPAVIAEPEEYAQVNESRSMDEQALEALIGSSNAKRRKLKEEVQIVDISSDMVLPDRNEWMRSALAAETTYQPRGVLVDEEPAPGTRKKHQITYLAHQAKANEAELQAMWAANRQTRRATASKYGF